MAGMIPPLPSSITIRTEHWLQMVEHVDLIAPLEACGLVAGIEGQSQGVFPITNKLQSPSRFYLEPQEFAKTLFLIEERGWDLLATFHSHPAGPSTPSDTDIAESAYSQTIHLILSPRQGQWQCRGFTIGADKEVREVTINLIP
jgi:proteasome lid subunit RPN8/RPN11